MAAVTAIPMSLNTTSTTTVKSSSSPYQQYFYGHFPLAPLTSPPKTALPDIPFQNKPKKSLGNRSASSISSTISSSSSASSSSSYSRKSSSAMLSPRSAPLAPPRTSSKRRTSSSGSQLPTATSRTNGGGRSPSKTSAPKLPILEEGNRDSISSDTTQPGKSVRPMVSLSAFPNPPNGAKRLSSLPTSPLSATSLPSPSLKLIAPASTQRSGSLDATSSRTASGTSRLKKPKALPGLYDNATAGSSAPNLPNGTGEGKSISGGSATRTSGAPSSLHSPPLSRCSSEAGSESTLPTTLEDSGEIAPRGRDRFGADGALDMGPEDSRGKSAKGSKGNVIVSVRVRPDAGGDQGKAEGEWMVDGRRSLVAYRGREGGNYFYDHVFTPHDQNAKVYDACAKRLVRRVMEGYHGTVFAYGMTGTGKTFSMQGTASSPGVIPLAITDIFSYIRETPHREFLLRVSYLEIYNEKIHDLLSVPTSSGVTGQIQQEEIKLREDSKRGVYATPLKEEIVQSPTQLLRVIARGDMARRTSSTQYNARSSRSHAVVQIVVESRERAAAHFSAKESKRSGLVPGGVRVSTLSLIDLAGSERAAESKERRQEGAHINKSLLTLGTVIARLSGDQEKTGKLTDRDGKHLPYRDSKLTRLLQPALSGNSLISILCTVQLGSAGSVVSPNGHIGETLNTLKFASRAKNNIVSHAKRAEESYGTGSGDAASRVLLERYRMEIQELRGQLDDQAREKREAEETIKEKEAAQRHEEQMLEMQLARTALKERIEHLNRLILCSKSTGVNSSNALLALGSISSTFGTSSSYISTSSTQLSSTGRSPTGVAGPGTLSRTVSTGSVSTNGHVLSNGILGDPNPDEEDSTGEYGDGTASLSSQVRALQADLADKNRYISTLERRLLQARRSSHSRTSLGFSPTSRLSEDGDVNALMREKDNEIADLRARLDDKDRMLIALRSAARKRDVADRGTDHRREGSPAVSPMAAEHPPSSSIITRSSLPKDEEEMKETLDQMILGSTGERATDRGPFRRRSPPSSS
ncbi:MAG: hypothetical protein M1816_003054 [Peltula sp. TS41687]|nr:MAG: hypothetical protein M1816_003054 [Peltula sp. TS41687]